jgi:hypothetical protein
MKQGWIGVDFDGTLVKHVNSWDGSIGGNIEPMIMRVHGWLDEGREVRIVTARVARGFDPKAEQWQRINSWCLDTFGRSLPITSEKDPGMIVLWDDRCVQVVRNTGMTPEELGRGQYTRLPRRED